MPHIAVWDDSMRSSTDLRTKQFAPLKLSATKDFVTECAAATDQVYGIVQSKPNVGDAMRLAIKGRWSAKVDGSGTAIAIGDLLGPNAAGSMLVKKTAAGANVCARALDVCTISAGIIDVMVDCGVIAGVVTLAS